MRARRGLDTTQKFLGFFGPNLFGTNHDGLGSDRPSPAQFTALARMVPAMWMREHVRIVLR
jgi:hypothetical protein